MVEDTWDPCVHCTAHDHVQFVIIIPILIFIMSVLPCIILILYRINTTSSTHTNKPTYHTNRPIIQHIIILLVLILILLLLILRLLLVILITDHTMRPRFKMYHFSWAICLKQQSQRQLIRSYLEQGNWKKQQNKAFCWKCKRSARVVSGTPFLPGHRWSRSRQRRRGVRQTSSSSSTSSPGRQSPCGVVCSTWTHGPHIT